MRTAWRIDASGVPHPGPGQPQGRAPTGALLFGALVLTDHPGTPIRESSRSTPNHSVGARPCGCPGADAGYAKRINAPDIHQYPEQPSIVYPISNRSNRARASRTAVKSIAQALASRRARRTPPRTGAATRACPYDGASSFRVSVSTNHPGTPTSQTSPSTPNHNVGAFGKPSGFPPFTGEMSEGQRGRAVFATLFL